MAKSRSFSIFLLKAGFSANNSLKDVHALGAPVTNASGIPQGASLYLLDNHPQPPWWKDYWGISQDLKQVLKGAIVFLPVSDRCFAITFGHTSHNLKDESYEYDFGLRTTLNALDPDKIKSTDTLKPESAKRERIQSPTAADLTFFEFNTDESIVRALSGMVKDEYKGILTNVTGASSLRISSKTPANEIARLCGQLLEIYKKEDFKEDFKEILNIVPIKDPVTIRELDEKLIEAFSNKSDELVLTIPEIFDYQQPFNVRYGGTGKDSAPCDDVYIDDYRKYLERRNAASTTVESLRSHRLMIQNEDGTIRKDFSVYRSLLFDCVLDSGSYHLCEGQWYRIEDEFVKKLKASLDPYFMNNDLLPDCDARREDKYNLSVAGCRPEYVCLDKTNIAPAGQTNVEPCDLYRVDENIAQFIHIKISTRSSTLSHLFNQGWNSIQLLMDSDETKDRLKELLPDAKLFEPVANRKLAVIYGIITAKPQDLKSDSLPLFSRISLRRTVLSFNRIGVKVSVVLINDNVDR